MQVEFDYDLIVVGSGSVGSAAGYYSHQTGLRVLMIDSYFPPHKEGSHHGQTRIMRQAYGEGDKYVPLLIKAQQLWDELQSFSQMPIFEKTGVLNAAKASSTFLQQAQNSAEKYDIPIEVLTADEVKNRFDVINLPDDYMAILEPNAGILYAENIIKTYISEASKNGCAQLFNCEVTGIEVFGDGVKVKTIDGDYTARKVCVSAGTWVKKLLPELPITAIRRVFAWHHADGRYSQKNNFPAFIIEDTKGEGYYGFPSVEDELKLGKHIDWQPINSPEERVPFGRDPSDGSSLLKFLKTFLPGVGGCLYGAACTYDMTEDEDFIIDTLPHMQNVLVITGLSGHGYKFASVLGNIVARFANDEASGFDLKAFKLSRFE